MWPLLTILVFQATGPAREPVYVLAPQAGEYAFLLEPLTVHSAMDYADRTTVGSLRAGDKVLVLEFQRGRGFSRYAKVRYVGPVWDAKGKQRTVKIEGWIPHNGDGLLALNASAADAALLARAQWNISGYSDGTPESEMGLCWALLQNFKQSSYRAAAWWRLARAADGLVPVLQVRLGIIRRDFEQRGIRGERETNTQFNGEVAHFERWGVRYGVGHYGSVRYDMDAFRRIVSDYPDSEFADDAAWALVNAPDDGEWENHPPGPLAEVAECEQFLSRFPTTPLRVEALTRIAFLCRYLQASYTWFEPDAERAANWRDRALRTYRRVLELAPGTLEAAGATSAIAEIDAGLFIFGGEPRPAETPQ